MSGTKDTGITARATNMLTDTIERIRNAPGQTSSPIRMRATQQVIIFAQGPNIDLMNCYELTSINALMLWAANEQHAAPETVEAITGMRFGVEHVTQLPRKDYDDVIRFLIDLRIDEMKN